MRLLIGRKVHRSNHLGFRRLRYGSSPDKYVVDSDSVSIGASSVSVNLINNSTQRALNLTIVALEGDIFRVKIDETDFQRYHLEGVLNGEPARAKYGYTSFHIS